jgi:hypothetical protein
LEYTGCNFYVQRFAYYCCQNNKHEMKNLLPGLILICSISIISCKKSGDNMPKDLALIQHKWNVEIEYGEVLRYEGTADDYYNFTTNNILYRRVNKISDTIAYTLLPGAHTLVFYPVVNGIKSTTPVNFNIDSLSTTALTITTYSYDPPITFQVFLRR